MSKTEEPEMRYRISGSSVLCKNLSRIIYCPSFIIALHFFHLCCEHLGIDFFAKNFPDKFFTLNLWLFLQQQTPAAKTQNHCFPFVKFGT